MAAAAEPSIANAEGSRVLPPRQRALVTIVSMAATIMVILDTTIANVALPHMQAALGATTESIGWVLTSYIVASAIAIPITGWLSDRIGRRRLFTLSVVGFTIASALCGAAPTLTAMVAARVAQGLAGAFIAPLGQSILLDINPRDRHIQAMTLWGMGTMIAPVMGPLVGAYLTDQFDWRWVFYVNLPIGIVVAFASVALLPEAFGPRRRFDFLGFGLMAAAIAGLQLMLDRGTHLDWFESTEIWIECGVTVACAWMLTVYLWRRNDRIVPVELFTDRNYVIGLVFITLLGGALFAAAALISPLLQRLLAVPVLESGFISAPRGIGVFLGFLIGGRLMRSVDSRLILLGGVCLTVYSMHMMTGLTLDMGSWPIIQATLVQGAGMGFILMPSSVVAFASLPQRMRTEGTAMYNLLRNLGGSLMIALSGASLASNLQINHQEIGERLDQSMFQSGLFRSLGIDAARIVALADAEVNRQASLIAYIDNFWMMTWLMLAGVPLIVLMKPPAAPPGSAGPSAPVIE